MTVQDENTLPPAPFFSDFKWQQVHQSLIQVGARHHLSNSEVSDLLELDTEMRRMRAHYAALRHMLARVIKAYEDSLEAEYSHRGENNPILREAHGLLESEYDING